MTALLLVALLSMPPPDGAMAAEALWDAARVALDHDRDVARARPLLARLVAAYPDSRAAGRARSTLEQLDALGPATDAWALPIEDEAAFIAAHPEGPATALVAIRHATTLPEAEAIDLLDRYQGDARWGWVVDREIGRRLFAEGRYIDAWRAADAAEDGGRARASLRMIAWRAAPVVLAVGLAGLFWWIRRRRRGAASAT